MFDKCLTDSELLLALCIFEEGLANPADYAARLRKAIQRSDQMPATLAEAKAWGAEWAKLREESDAAKRILEQVRLDNTAAIDFIELMH